MTPVAPGLRNLRRRWGDKPTLTLLDPLQVPEIFIGAQQIPDVIEWTLSDRYLDQAGIYPRQGTLLKCIFLQDELFCADEQTEILTRRGWMRYDRVIEGEDVLTIQPDTGLAEWAPADRINVFPVVDEPLVSMEGYGHSSLTTPNHRWLVERLYQHRGGGSDRRRQFIETRDLIGTRDRITCAAPVLNLPSQPKWDDAFVELAGWYWTEGHLRASGAVTIVQSHEINPGHVDRIRACLISIFGEESPSLRGKVTGWRESQYRAMTCFRLSHRAAEALREAVPGQEKVPTTDFLTSLTQAQLDLFIRASIDADGTAWTMPSGKIKREITQKSRARLDAFQMACSLAGIRTTLMMRPIRGSGPYAGQEQWHLSLYDQHQHFTPQTRGRNFSITEVRHTGHVWCPTTKNGTWLARRDGKVYFTGNTQYDYDVIGQWGEDFARTNFHGCQPDLLERIQICKAQGRPWFREVIGVIGRRGSKGYLGALSGSYVLWHYMHRPGGPQAYYDIERNKKLVGITFAGKRGQAKENQWRDITSIIRGAPCFGPYISRDLAEIMTIFAPSDILRAQRQQFRGVDTEADQATFELVPRESTLMAARGPAAFMQHYDEMAHVVATGINRSAGEVYNAATPALDQFHGDGFIYAGSSPWQMAGRYYEMWQESIAKNEDGSPAFPEKFMVQLESWDPYEDWTRADQIITRPTPKVWVYIQRDVSAYESISVPVEVEGQPQYFAHKRNAIQTYDDNMRQIERANPDNFRVERRSRWAAVLDAYLDEKKVAAVFDPWQGDLLRIQQQGLLDVDYVAHGDPGLVNDAFGFSLGHVEVVPTQRTNSKGELVTEDLRHVIFDVIDCWEPATFEEHRIDYLVVEDDLKDYHDRFLPVSMTFDQWNSASSIAHLRKHVVDSKKPRRTDIYTVDATEKLAWAKAEIFKAAINLDLVHAPMLDAQGQPHDPSVRAELEMRFLQRKNKRVDHPSSGPVQSKDVWDTMAEVVWRLIGQDMARVIGLELSSLGLATGLPGGANAYSNATTHPAGQNDISQVADAFARASRGSSQGSHASARGVNRQRR